MYSFLFLFLLLLYFCVSFILWLSRLLSFHYISAATRFLVHFLCFFLFIYFFLLRLLPFHMYFLISTMPDTIFLVTFKKETLKPMLLLFPLALCVCSWPGPLCWTGSLATLTSQMYSFKLTCFEYTRCLIWSTLSTLLMTTRT